MGLLAGMSVEGMAADIEMRTRNRAHRQELDGLEQQVLEWQETHGGMLAERQALREALRKFAPDHPLLNDKALRAKIFDVGGHIFMATDDDSAGDKAIAVGKNAQYPYEQPPSVAALQAKVDQLEAENVQNYAEKHALRRVVKRYASSHPLVWKVDGSPVIANLRRIALTTFSFTKDYAAVQKAAVEMRFPNDYAGYGPIPCANPLEEYPSEELTIGDFYQSLRDPVRQRAVLKTREMLRAQASATPK